MVVVDLALATICFAGGCHPALVGDNTPTGIYEMAWRATDEPGYGGDLLVFRENRTQVWAVHRVYTLDPDEQRVHRLRSNKPRERRSVTRGCINVMPRVYRELVDCCRDEPLVIVR